MGREQGLIERRGRKKSWKNNKENIEEETPRRARLHPCPVMCLMGLFERITEACLGKCLLRGLWCHLLLFHSHASI